MILLTGGHKGGIGKTTIATNMAVMLQKKSHEVLLIDSDKHKSASKWCAVRDRNKVNPRILSIQKLGSNLYEDVISLKDKYNNIIIDTGGFDSIELRAGLMCAEIAVLPIRASQFDLWTLSELNDLIGEIKVVNRNLRAQFYINHIPTNPNIKELKNAIQLIEDSNFQYIPLANSRLYERIVYRSAIPVGMTVHELRSDPKAEKELDALYEEIFNG